MSLLPPLHRPCATKVPASRSSSQASAGASVAFGASVSSVAFGASVGFKGSLGFEVASGFVYVHLLSLSYKYGWLVLEAVQSGVPINTHFPAFFS